jgi:hypothetical protein
MQTTGNLVRLVVEFTACVQYRKYYLNGWNAEIFVDIDRDSAPVVIDFDRSICLERNFDQVAISRQGFIDKMMKPTLASAANIHCRAFAYRFQSL